MKSPTPQRLLVGLSLALLTSLAAYADVDVGVLTKQLEQQQLQQQLQTPQESPQVESVAPAVEQGPKVRVKNFRIRGASLFNAAQLQELLSGLTGRDLSFAELQKKAAEIIAKHYRQHDRLARIDIQSKDIQDGSVTLNVVEVMMGDVRLGKAVQTRLDPDTAKNYFLAQQQPGKALDMDKIERATLLLNDLPGVDVASVIAKGVKPNQSDVVLKAKDKPLFTGSAIIDTTGARQTGIWRGGLDGAMNNLMGVGDQTRLQFQKNEGTASGRTEFSRPVGYNGLRVGVNLNGMEYKVDKSTGHSINAGVNASYPIIRSSDGNLKVVGGYARKFYQGYNDSVEVSDKFIDVGNVNLLGDLSDKLAGGGTTQANVGVTGGRVALAGSSTSLSADKAGAKTDGGYGKLTYALSRRQRITSSTSFWASFSGQFAAKNLDSSESFILGGPSGVRAYPLLEGVGSEGWLFNAELRQNIYSKLHGAVFFDHGSIKRRHDTYPGAGPLNLYDLSGVGGYLTLSDPGNYALRLTVATPLTVNPARDATGNDSDGRQADPRFWLSAVKFF